MKMIFFISIVLFSCNSVSNDTKNTPTKILDSKINTHIIYYRYKFKADNKISNYCAAYLIIRNSSNSELLKKMEEENSRALYEVGGNVENGPVLYLKDLNLFEIPLNGDYDSLNSDIAYSTDFVKYVNTRYDSLSLIGHDTINKIELGRIEVDYCEDSQSFKKILADIAK